MNSSFFRLLASGLLVAFLLPSPFANAQVMLKGASDIGELNWWLGLKTGVTFTKVKPTESYSVLSEDSDGKDEQASKKYSKTLSNMGETIGIIFGYAFQKNVLLTFQPAYSNYKYAYSTKYRFDSQSGEAYEIETKQTHRIGYIELPVTIMFRTLIGRVEPYVHAGWYYGAFVGGTKKIKYNETLGENGVATTTPFQTEVFGMGNTMMKSQMGFTGGLGVAYTIQYFRIGLEASYRQGMYNATDVKKRYNDKHLVSKFFDVPDDLKLNQIEITLNFYMPVDNLIHLHSGQKSKGGARK